jgi:hypothetical protein
MIFSGQCTVRFWTDMVDILGGLESGKFGGLVGNLTPNMWGYHAILIGEILRVQDANNIVYWIGRFSDFVEKNTAKQLSFKSIELTETPAKKQKISESETV